MADPLHPNHSHARSWWLLLSAWWLVLLWVLHAELLFHDTVPAAYDLTGHIVPIAELQQRLLPQLRVHGWSTAWFAGFPLFYFYFPLPALLTALLGFWVPLSIALKLSTVVGVLLLPLASYTLARALKLTRAEGAVMAVVGTTFLLMQSFFFLGGNIASTIAGEFAYSISFSLSLFYLAALLRARNEWRAAAWPGVLLALTALSHLATTFAIVAVGALLLPGRNRGRIIAGSWVIGFLLTAFWALPFLIRHGLMAEVHRRADRSLAEILPLEIWPVLLAAIIAAAVLRRDRALLPLLLLGIAGLAGYVFAERVVYPGRFLPYWYLALHLLAGFGAARMLFTRRRTGALVLLLLLSSLNVVRGTGYLRNWSYATFAGLEARANWPALAELFGALQRSQGRSYFEEDAARLAQLGSRNLPAATPYFVDSAQVLNGLWAESSALHAELQSIDSLVNRIRAGEQNAMLTQAIMLRLRDVGATRFVALNPQTANALARAPGIRLLADNGSFALFELPAAPLVSENARVLEWGSERIRFQTAALRKPHVVRMAHFPNWRLSDGSRPQRTTDGMMLVTPVRQEVVLEFRRTWVEMAGAALTLVTLFCLLLWQLRLRWLPSPRAG